jgi:hypothetical protein
MYYTENTTVKNNNIIFRGIGGSTTNYAYWYYAYQTWTMVNNRLDALGNSVYLYNYYRPHNGLAPRSLVANNIVSGGTFYHYNGNNAQYIDYVNNTYSSGGGYFYLNGASSVTSMKIRNNIFRGTTYGMYWSAAPNASSVTSDYNLFIGSATPIYAVAARSLTTMRSTYSAFEQNSIQANPGFISNANPMPNLSNANVWNIAGRGEHLDSNFADYNNVARPGMTGDGVPDLGAIEIATPTSVPANCVAVPSTPTAGGTSVFLNGLDTVMTIAWDALATAPTSCNVKLYTGEIPPQIGSPTGLGYSYFYVDIAAPSGFYTYTPTLYYNPSWIGTVPSETNLRLSYKASGFAWSNLTFSNSIADSTMDRVIAGYTLSDLPAFMALTDDNAPLPVELVRLTGERMEMNAMLNWTTASEKNSSHFEIERSFNGKTFVTAGKVESNHNSNRLNNYRFEDMDVFAAEPKVVYYRLRMVDMDGSFAYSNVITISNQEKTDDGGIKVFPNPLEGRLFVEFATTSSTPVSLRDMSGRLVWTGSIEAGEVHEVNIPANLNNGVYFLSVGDQVTKLIKN